MVESPKIIVINKNGWSRKSQDLGPQQTPPNTAARPYPPTEQGLSPHQVGNRPPVGPLGVFRIGNLAATSLDTMIEPGMQIGAGHVIHHVNRRLVLDQALLVVSNLTNRCYL